MELFWMKKAGSFRREVGESEGLTENLEIHIHAEEKGSTVTVRVEAEPSVAGDRYEALKTH